MGFKCTILVLILSVVLESVFAQTPLANETASQPLMSGFNETHPGTARKGRHIIEERIEIGVPGKNIKRHIITIPPSVSKVKLVQPPLNLRHSRGPQQFKRYSQSFRSAPRRPSKKSQTDYDFQLDDPFGKKVKRNLKKPMVKEVNPQEFYADDEFESEDAGKKLRGQKHRVVHKVIKMKRKIPKTNILGEYIAEHDGAGRPSYEEGAQLEASKAHQTVDASSFYEYDPSATSIHMKQVPPPNLYPLKVVDTPQTPDKPVYGKFYEEKYIPGLSIKKLPSKSRQIQSLFSQQYTTHNPHVTTNFGLNGFGGQNNFQYGAFQKGSFVDSTPYELVTLGKFNQPAVAASEQVVTSLPVLTPGIQVIQPPQFRDVTVSHPPNPSRLVGPSSQKEEISSQRATIRDILDQDCPSHDIKGYCESPPRYPMQQISNMVKKCANLMEAMNTQPFEEPHDVYTFAKRSDSDGDDASNTTDPTEESVSWSRSSTDVVTACSSDLTFTEPGYAKEATSGRWFVIVQHPDTTIQRIATDTCRNPGKPCGGLSGLKCSKANGFPQKSTKCVQRFTYQRLISWDPEHPEGCPRMRVFRFPSACLCHLPN